jgi:hypothetical protein
MAFIAKKGDPDYAVQKIMLRNEGPTRITGRIKISKEDQEHGGFFMMMIDLHRLLFNIILRTISFILLVRQKKNVMVPVTSAPKLG